CNVLNKDIQEEKSITISQKEYDDLVAENAYIKQQLADLKRLIFGRKSEKISPIPGLPTLFDSDYQEEVPEETKEITYTKAIKKKKEKPVRKGLPSHLPRIEEIIEPEGITDAHKRIGEEITEILEYTPARMYVRRIIRPKYIDPQTEIISIGLLPSMPIPKGIAGPTLLAHIMVSKFIDHLPLYRQLKIFKRIKVDISSSTIGGWFAKIGELITPLYKELEQCVLYNTDYLQVDESPIKVQDKDKKGSLHQGYMWVVREPVSGLVLFKYNKGRSKSVPELLFKNFTGTLQTDGYQVYKSFKTKGEITLLGCMAHARRYFEKARDNDYPRAKHALGLIQQLYLIERKAKEKTIDTETKYRYRQLYAVPILNTLKKWLKDNQMKVMPKSSIAKAINYALSIFDNLERYTEDGRYEIDNNMIENSIRPLALGRKNYLFAGNHVAAQSYAMMYSFFATCKINNVNPQEWLSDVLDRIQDHSINKLNELLPHNWKNIMSHSTVL
ncbi:MAG TPA: IS66 family transposase, partial [Bacteroidetes bacterium]|nr:IS66 family transposase [Bacteroidota bacterium]